MSPRLGPFSFCCDQLQTSQSTTELIKSTDLQGFKLVLVSVPFIVNKLWEVCCHMAEHDYKSGFSRIVSIWCGDMQLPSKPWPKTHWIFFQYSGVDLCCLSPKTYIAHTWRQPQCLVSVLWTLKCSKNTKIVNYLLYLCSNCRHETPNKQLSTRNKPCPAWLVNLYTCVLVSYKEQYNAVIPTELQPD